MTNDGPGDPRRRTLLTGAAWSVPVIALAATAPAAAASGMLTTRLLGLSPGIIEYEYATEITAIMSGYDPTETNLRGRFTPLGGGTPIDVTARAPLNQIRLPIIISARLLAVGLWDVSLVGLKDGRDLVSNAVRLTVISAG